MHTSSRRLGAALFISAVMASAHADEAVPCSAKSVETGRNFRVMGDVALRAAPSADSNKLLNHKAMSVLGGTHYLNLDTTVAVREQCREMGWSRVGVTEPEWLIQSHVGWVRSTALRASKIDDTGAEQYTEADFRWDKRTMPYKRTIVDGVNMLRRTDARCKYLDPATADLSSRSKPGAPVFYVTCGKGPVVNVFFTPGDVAKRSVR